MRFYVGLHHPSDAHHFPRACVSIRTLQRRREAIAQEMDLNLHAFGVKTTALAYPGIQELLFSADSMAWSYAARRQGRNRHSWQEAQRFVDRLESMIERNRRIGSRQMDLLKCS